MVGRRAFILGLGATLAVIRTPGLLMPIKPVRMTTAELAEEYLRLRTLRFAQMMNVIDQAAMDTLFYGQSMVEYDREGFPVRVLNPRTVHNVPEGHSAEICRMPEMPGLSRLLSA